MPLDLRRVPARGAPEETLEFMEVLDPVRSDLNTVEAVFDGGVGITGEVIYSDHDILIQAVLNGTRRLECSRCLEKFRRPFTKTLSLNFEMKKKVRTIDVLPEIGEELRLESPLNIFCKKDCKGLCPHCGANRNRDACACGTGPQ